MTRIAGFTEADARAHNARVNQSRAPAATDARIVSRSSDLSPAAGALPTSSTTGREPVSPIELTLPWPPSVNKHFALATALTAADRAFRRQVMWLCRKAKVRPLRGRLVVELTMHAPARRPRYDLDNRVKRTLDALQHGRCFENDDAVDRLVVERGEPRGDGECRVVIMERAA